METFYIQTWTTLSSDGYFITVYGYITDAAIDVTFFGVRVLLRLVCGTTAFCGTLVIFQYRLYLDGKALGTNERIMSCAHVRQNQKQTPQPPKVYNLKERRCSFVPLTRQRNTASISSGTIRLNQAPGYSP